MKKGFTLLEMIVVILIIAILLLLTIPRIQTTFSIVSNKGCEAQMKIVDTAILEFMILHDRTPTSISDLVNEHLLNDNQNRCQDGSLIYVQNGEATRDE